MNCYEVLGLDRGATDVEVREAWRRRVLRSHKDQGGTDAKFIEARQAYEVLIDPEKRRAHDAELDQAATGATPATVQPRTLREAWENAKGRPATEREERGLRVLDGALGLLKRLPGRRRR